jgi:hypothetical protein
MGELQQRREQFMINWGGDPAGTISRKNAPDLKGSKENPLVARITYEP